MRWPWRSADRAVGEVTEATSVDPVVVVPAAGPTPSRTDWRRVGSLRPTVDSNPPALLPLGLPVLASTRSLVHRPRTTPSVSEVPAGRVSGLTSATAPLSEPPIVAEPDALPDNVTRAVRPVATAGANRPGTLVHAVADYVGEPYVPAVPHRAPAWLKAASSAAAQQTRTPLDAFASPMSLEDMRTPDEPRTVTPQQDFPLLDSWSGPPPPPPALLAPTATPDAVAAEPEPVEPPAPPPRAVPARRRRPGLGMPLPPGERPPAPPPPSREPAAVRPAPVQGPVVPTPSAIVVPAPPVVLGVPVDPLPVVPAVSDHQSPVAEGAAGVDLVHPRVSGRFSARVPADLADTFHRAYGMEVADVEVDRSVEAAEEARSLGARAFARDDLIVLPDEAGPVEAGEARALLGHELAHVVQQRTLGGTPDESGQDGQRLEVAARSVERWVRAGASGPPPPAVPDPPPAFAPRSTPTQSRRAHTSAPAGSVQRAVAGAVADAPVQTVVVPSTPGTVAAPATLIHPNPLAPVLQQAGQPDHDPLNPRDRHELGALVASSFKDMGLDMFGLGSSAAAANPRVNPPATQRGLLGGFGAGAGTGAGAGAGTGMGGGGGAQAQLLREQALERINMVRDQQGQERLTELPESEEAVIAAQLGQGGGGFGGMGQYVAPEINNFADLKDQVRLGAGELLGSFIGINPVDNAERERQAREAKEAKDKQDAATAAAAGTTAAAGGVAAAGQQAAPTPAAEPTGAQLARMYDRIHTRLLRELIVGRERSGTLMDFR